MKLLACDTETTGLDLYSGARPFLVTLCTLVNSTSNISYYEWPVDPETRQPQVPIDDLLEIQQEIDEADFIVGQNFKFDVSGLTMLYQDYGLIFHCPWDRVYDTLIAGHLLASNRRHDLTSMAIQYLGEDIAKYEAAVKKQALKARVLARREFPRWSIATKENPLTPSARKSTWAFDMWLPRQIATEYNYSENHPWWTVTSEYANVDSPTTAYLWKSMEKKLRKRELWAIFKERMKLAPIAMELEMRGVTVSINRINHTKDTYREASEDLATTCRNIASSYDYNLTLPKSGNNTSLRDFCFGTKTYRCESCLYSWPAPFTPTWETAGEPVFCPMCMAQREEKIVFDGEGGFKTAARELDETELPNVTLIEKPYLGLPVIKRSAKTGAPSLDKASLETYVATLPPRSKAAIFVKALKEKRKRDTAIQYLNGYSRYWRPIEKEGADYSNWRVLHGSANPTGTNTLRWSFSNPNSANISKQENFNLRHGFGPLPDQEWWSMDGQNLELRIPAYEAGEEDLIYVFEHPTDPPYYGSYHLVVFDALHPELFRKHGADCKEIYESTWYQWTKNFNFALIYGCQEAKGDATARVPGAYKKIRSRFPKIAQLADKQIALARRYGYVQTIPDKLVDPNRGYPINCTDYIIRDSRTEYNDIAPTLPLNYHIQSTAMWWTGRAMVKCQEKLVEWQREGFDAYITLQVHDELVFCMPKSRRHPKHDYEKEKTGKTYFRTSNLWRARVLQRLMESCGDSIGVPTPVSVEYNDVSWDVGQKFKG